MEGILDMFAAAGQYFWLIVIACAELLAAILLLGLAAGRKKQKMKRKTGRLPEAERIFLRECGECGDEVWLLLRRSDRMPVYVTKRFEEFLGVSLQKLQDDVHYLGRRLSDSGQGEDFWNTYMEWEGDAPLRIKKEWSDGFWIAVTIRRSSDQEYDIFSFLEFTRIQHLVENYEMQLSKAKDASESKTTFLYRMSHEIRTPMNGIMGMLTLAKEKMGTDDAALLYLERTEEIAQHLLALINDILDMSRIEAGKVELEKKAFSLRNIGRRLYDMYAKSLEERGIAYAVNFEEVTVDYLIGDELRLNQIIMNFLSNAVKFTSEGEIVVTFRQMMLQENGVDLMISVHDTGIGIEPEFINRLFRPFEQESTETSKKFGGTGLGMAITDQLVKQMGGEIVVRSVPQEGSDFSVFLHFPVAGEDAILEASEEEKSLAAPSDHVFEGRRILMAEDNEINAMVAEEILGNMGAEVEVVLNGKLAAERFEEHPEHYYDFILMDIQMPVMDGREATRLIRSLPRPDAQSILIFGLSADAFVEDERRSLECGMNAHYAKPIDFVKLRQSIGMFLH